MLHVSTDALSIDSTVIKVHPDGTVAFKKMVLSLLANPAADGQKNYIQLPHLYQCAAVFSLSSGPAGDAPEGRKLLTALGKTSEPCAMIMDRAYGGDETRKLVSELGFSPVVPPQKAAAQNLGNMTRFCIKNEMKSSGCSGG